ncbi:MAG: hypothetical protein AAF721_10080 [Myxococcota bacterium]
MLRYLSPLFLVGSLAAACSVSDAGPANDTTERGPLGKADAVGTCELPNGVDFCGGKGTGNCWCDDACVDFGDCCSDAGEVCEIDDAGDDDDGEVCGEVLCALFCENGFKTDEDGCEVCECQGQFCGGIANIQCPQGEQCVGVGDFPDAGGFCEPFPFCGGFPGFPCPEGLICVDIPGDGCDPPEGADCGGMCVPPVEECTPETCGPAPEVATIDCGDGTTAGPVCSNEDGECSWTITTCPDPGAPSCQDNCGGNAGGCWCDDLCTGYGDCCEDYLEECTEPSGTECGDETCTDGEVCVTQVTQIGLMPACAEIPESCENGEASCSCMGENVCIGPFGTCSDDDDGGLSCHCPNC